MTPIERFDSASDRALERLRGHRTDRIFLAASELGDFSLIWHIVVVARGLTSEQHATQTFLLAALIGLESLIVNQGIKRVFRRRRPTEAGDPRYPVRRPSTSSFPSGHASAAFFVATLLTMFDGARWAPLWFALAAVVGTSRAFVRIHHVSDVVAGAIVGAALAFLFRFGVEAMLDIPLPSFGA